MCIHTWAQHSHQDDDWGAELQTVAIYIALRFLSTLCHTYADKRVVGQFIALIYTLGG